MKKNKKNNQSQNNVEKTPKQESSLQKFIKQQKEPKELALTPEYKETVKFNSWVRAFFDKENKKTFGNATESALYAYNTDNRVSAASIGHQNLRKLQTLGADFLEKEGYGFGELMKIGTAKMLEGDYDVWERFMTKLGYFEPPKPAPTLNQFNFNMGDAIAESRKERGLDE